MKQIKATDWSSLLFLALVVCLPLAYVWHRNRTANSIVEAVEKYAETVENQILKANPAGPTETPFAEIVERHFATWTKGDGNLTLARTRQLLRDVAVKGEEAAALAAVHDYFRKHHTDLNNRETLILSVSRKDLVGSGQETTWMASRFESHWDHLKQLNRQLFADVDSPTLTGISQGHIADCYLLSTIGSTIQTKPAALRQLIEARPDGSFDVRFRDGEHIHVPPLSDGMLALGSRTGKQGLWLNVLEVAYGNHRLFGKTPTGELPEDALDYGHPSRVMEVFTGQKGTNVEAAKATDAQLRAVIQAGVRRKALIVATAPERGKLPPGVVGHHCYAVLDFDAATDHVKIWNPWGARLNFQPAGSPGLEHGYEVRAGIFLVPIRDFRHVFPWLTYDLAEVGR